MRTLACLGLACWHTGMLGSGFALSRRASSCGTRVHRCIHTRTHMHMRTHTQIRTHALAHIHTRTHTFTPAGGPACVARAQTHAHTHTHAHAHTHTHTHTLMHIHNYRRASLCGARRMQGWSLGSGHRLRCGSMKSACRSTIEFQQRQECS